MTIDERPGTSGRNKGPTVVFRLPRMLRTGMLVGFLAAAFVWIGIEDTSTLPVSLLGALASGLAVSMALERRFGESPTPVRRWLTGAALAGLLSGALAAPMAVLMMVLKVSLHAHPLPDFTLTQVIAVLGRAPVWAAAGAMLGAAVGLIGLVRRSD